MNKVIIFGNRTSCSRSARLAGVVVNDAGRAALAAAGFALIDADYRAGKADYLYTRTKYGLAGSKLPVVVITSSDGTLLAKFFGFSPDLSPVSLAALQAKIKAACPTCSDPCGGTCSDEPVKVCPTCKRPL